MSIRRACIAMFVVTLAAGCTTLPEPYVAPAGATAAATDGATPYPLGAGDKLRISVYNEAALTGEYTVTGGGYVSFPLIGNVAARGLTIEGLQDAIRARLSQGIVLNPRVTVEVLAYRPYYILGEVTKPGEYPFSIGLSVDQAVATAGGYTYRANDRRVFLRRGEGVERTVEIKGQPAFEVRPGDTIRVGERYF